MEMNAYELADILHQSDFLAMDFAEDAANFIRQQAGELEAMLPNMMALNHIVSTQRDRIAELEKLVEEMKYEKSSGVYDLNDEKIANVWLFLEGKAQGVLESGGTFNFPVEFYKAIKEITEG